MAITISGVEHPSYATVAEGDAYLGAAIHAANWTAATTLQKQQALITATRMLDRQMWATAYETFAVREALVGVKNATIELALALLDGAEVQTAATTSGGIAAMSAGSVSITFRRMAAGQIPLRFPLIVHELLRPYLGGSSVGVRATVTGVDAESIFPLDFGIRAG